MTVVIVDHGAGNLRSLRAGLERAGARAVVSGEPERVAGAARLVLPGVGSAAAAIARMRRTGLAEAVEHAALGGAHLLGVCLGMQLLFEHSEEGGCDCLGLLAGGVRRIGWSRRLPHMGWNEVTPAAVAHPLTAALPAVCYFAHSFAAEPAAPADVLATTELDGRDLPSLAGRGRVVGAQFHPEKSGPEGLRLLTAWLAWSDDAA